MSTDQAKLLFLFRFHHIRARLRKSSAVNPVLTPGGHRGSTRRLARGKRFSIFDDAHKEEAADIYNALISIESCDEFWDTCEELKTFLNEGLYLYAVNVAVENRPDANHLDCPPLYQVNPRSYFPAPSIAKAGATIPASDITCIPHFETGTDCDPEFNVAWWREDIGLNAHHFEWHVVYAHNHERDRKGELFYYMHHQMLARYDAERIAVGLPRVKPYDDWGVMEQGYDSHLTDYYGTNHYSPRPSKMTLADEHNASKVIEQRDYYAKIKEAIKTGIFKLKDGKEEPVNIVNLGAAVESSTSSPNHDLYGSIHNTGHNLISKVTDPDGRYKQEGGVMAATETAVRDPIFFRWHKFIDSIFAQHKETLDPYTKSELSFEGITVNDVKIGTKNTISTNMESHAVNIAKDMFKPQDNEPHPNTDVKVIVMRVNHEDFVYSFTVTNNYSRPVQAAFRVFLAPKEDKNGTPIPLVDRRSLFIEMDKFSKKLTPGKQNFDRSSKDSSVIKPPAKTLEEIEADEKAGVCSPDKDSCECRGQRYCKCGWAYNMLVPRGTKAGMAFELFVMLTNWEEDRVDTDDLDQGTSYCGIRSKKYPDKRAMGFPFDRKFSKDYLTLDKLVGGFPNMHKIPITVKYQEK